MSSEHEDDGSLLQQFVLTGNEEPFNELIRRHGALVHGACHRILGQTQDAEDATQAVFLTLANKAKMLRGYRSVAGWLHNVAWNISRCAKKAAQCRRNRELEAGAVVKNDQECAEWEQIRPLLDSELESLPEKYRVPLILHHIEGRTQNEITRVLGCTGGALSRRISRAEELLRKRLVRRGVTFAPAVLFPMILKNAPVPVSSALAESTGHAIALTRNEASSFSPQVTALHKGAMKSMFIKKVTIAASILFAALLTGGAAHAIFNVRSSRAPMPAAGPVVVARNAVPFAPVSSHGATGGNESDRPAKTSPNVGQNDPEISAWIAQLGSDNSNERLAAMQSLRKSGSNAQTALKVAAEKGTGEAKARAATLLGVQQTAAALQRIAVEAAKIKNYEADVDSMKLAGGIRIDAKGHIKAIPGSQLYAMDMTTELQGLKIAARAVSDGKTAWNEIDSPMGKHVMKAKVTAEKNEGMSLDLNAFTQKYDFVSSRMDTSQGRQTLVFTGVMRDDANNDGSDPYADGYSPTNAVTAYVDPATMLLNKFEMMDDKGVITMSSTYSNIKRDVALDTAQFAYVPPADVEVWDTDNPIPAKTTPEAVADAARTVENTAVKPAAVPSAPSAPVVPNATAELLQKIAAVNKAIANFEADEDHVLTMQGMTITSKSHIRDISATHRFIIDRTSQITGMMNIPSRIVCDGATIYDEESFPETGTKLRKSILKMDFKDRPHDEPSLNINSIKAVNGDGFEFTGSREETVDGAKQYMFDAVMREPKAGDKPSALNQIKGKKSYTIAVAATDLLLRSVEIKDDKGATIESTKYTNVKHDVAIDENAFLYSPPAGVKVTDLNDLKNTPATLAPQSGKDPTKSSDF